MPGLDHKGPQGEGPRTGRQMGNCRPKADVNQSQTENPVQGAGLRGGPGFGRGAGRGFGRGSGKGFGRGFGKGFGRGFGRGPINNPNDK